PPRDGGLWTCLSALLRHRAGPGSHRLAADPAGGQPTLAAGRPASAPRVPGSPGHRLEQKNPMTQYLARPDNLRVPEDDPTRGLGRLIETGAASCGPARP